LYSFSPGNYQSLSHQKPKEIMMKFQLIVLSVCLSMAYASSYGNNFNSANSYSYTGSYVGANTAGYRGANTGQLSSRYGYQGYGKDYSAYGKGTSGYGANVYNNVILPHPYPVPVPIPIFGQTGSRYGVVGNGASTNNGLLGFGNGGIFGKIISSFQYDCIMSLSSYDFLE
jgi:hypothetical protein